MPSEDLKRHLDRLREELAADPELDAETRAMLEDVALSIERALEGQHDEPHTVRERVEGATVRFEAEHPRFARVLSEVTDALAKIGV